MGSSVEMKKALNQTVIPALRREGFTGRYPHFRRILDDRIELLSFQTNKWGGSFRVEASAVFPDAEGKLTNFLTAGQNGMRYRLNETEYDTVSVWNTSFRYTFPGMFDGWFYYVDVYRCFDTSFKRFCFRAADGRAGAERPRGLFVRHVWKDDETVYQRVCAEVERQLSGAYVWWTERSTGLTEQERGMLRSP